MDITLVKALPKKILKAIRMHPATGPMLVYVGFILLVLLTAVLPFSIPFKAVILGLGWVMLEDILHFLKFKYSQGE